MPVPQGYQYQQVQQQRPSCWDKLKMGFIMGCMIGGSTGLIIGSFTTFKFVIFLIPKNFVYRITDRDCVDEKHSDKLAKLQHKWAVPLAFLWPLHRDYAVDWDQSKGPNPNEAIAGDDNLIYFSNFYAPIVNVRYHLLHVYLWLFTNLIEYLMGRVG